MDIPEDVVTLILVRLPVKSLMKFRCVCKAWYSLIGSHGFIDRHLQHPSQNEYLVLMRFDDDENTMLSFYCRDLLQKAAPDWRAFPPRMASIGGPINGIILVGGDRYHLCAHPESFRNEHPLYLCNPATREIRKIPDRPFGFQRARPYEWSAYRCRRKSVGFGYDPRTKDYKVVSIMHFIDGEYRFMDDPYGPLTIEIYELGSNSWRVADTVFPTIVTRPDPDENREHGDEGSLDYDELENGMFREFMCGVFLNGSIHWTALLYTKVILAFDISDEVMRAFHLPRGTSTLQNSSPRSLFVLDDSLAFVQRVLGSGEYYPRTTSVYVWVMVEYGDDESWTKRYLVETGVFMDVLAYWDNILIWETDEGELASCDPKEDAPHHLRKHHHINRYVPKPGNQQPILQGSFKLNLMGAIVMNKESMVRLS